MHKNTLIICVLAASALLTFNRAHADDWTQLWTTSTLSQARWGVAGTSVGSKVFFAGGYTGSGGVYSNVVDVYDTATNAWSHTTLSQASWLVGASAGGKAFFGGGNTTGGDMSVVDVYDGSTLARSNLSLPQPRTSAAAVSSGTMVLFGGGFDQDGPSNAVDIYDTATNTWSTTHLSHAGENLTVASAGGKVLFAGGWTGSDTREGVEIYNTATGGWTTASLSMQVDHLAASTWGSKAYFGGGYDSSSDTISNYVDIYDSATDSWSTSTLSQAREIPTSAASNGKVFFAGGYARTNGNSIISNVVDILDTSTGTWKTATLSQPRGFLASAAAGNKVFFAGGATGFATGATNAVDIYTFQNYPSITSTKAFMLVDNTTVAGLMKLTAGSLFLSSYNLTVGSMSGTATINLGSKTLTVGTDNTDSSYSGLINGSGSLVKTGIASLTLSGASSYLGRTTISSGELHLIGSNAWKPIMNYGGAYLSGGELIFDYTGGSDPYATIQGLLNTKINGSMPLAVVDDTVNNCVIVSLIVPEPTTLALLGMGGIGMIAYGWRRRKTFRILVCFIALLASTAEMAKADTFGTGANQFNIDFVPISGATNPTSGISAGIGFTFSGVNHDYRMGTFEITNDQWNKFKAAYGTVTGNPLTAYDTAPTNTGANMPTNSVSWYEAAQFVNWLNTSTGHQAAYKFTGTQGTSDYTLATWSAAEAEGGTNLYRNKDAYYFLPTEDEWVKAAYWNGTSLQTYATKEGETLTRGYGTNGTGWNYYTNTPPYGPWAVGSGSQELNGTYDMMGNAGEWTESPWTNGDYGTSSMRSVRGGSANFNSDVLASSYHYAGNPTYENPYEGFRVASVPEPGSIAMLLSITGGGLLFWRQRR